MSIPLDMAKETEGILKMGSSQTPLVSYFGMQYKNSKNVPCLFVAKVDFKTGIAKFNVEPFDKKKISDLEKAYVGPNKQFSNINLGDPDWLFFNNIKEYGDQLLVGLSTTEMLRGVTPVHQSIILQGFDTEMKPAFRQFIPRYFISNFGEGTDVSFNCIGNATLKVVATTGDGMFGGIAIHSELDLKTGKITALNTIDRGDVPTKFYPSTKSIWWKEKSFMIPYIERKMGFGNKFDVQLLQLSY